MHIPLRTAWIAAGWCLVATVTALTLIPPPEMALLPDFRARDKLGHLLAYLLLMWWFAQAYPGARWPAIALRLAAMGVILEFCQLSTLYRSFELLDMLANVSGVMAGLLLARLRRFRVPAMEQGA